MTLSRKRARNLTLVAVATFAALLTPGSASASESTPESQTPPDPITIEVLAANGSGCKAGTTKITANSDNTGFKVRYSDFLAEDGGNSEPSDFRKNCQLGVQVHVPQGFTFAIAQAEYRGKVNLRPEASALHRTTYYFQGSSDSFAVDHDLEGPKHGTWSVTDFAPVTELVYAPCGSTRILNVNTELRVYAGSDKRSSISMSATEGNVDTLIRFRWKRC